MSENALVALIQSVGNVAGLVVTGVMAIFLARLQRKVEHVRRDAAATRHQVENNHSTNLREEADERHQQNRHLGLENSRKLDSLIEGLDHVRHSLGRVWAKLDGHTEEITELQELTSPRQTSRFAPPTARHRQEP